jgi:hypothetical protein
MISDGVESGYLSAFILYVYLGVIVQSGTASYHGGLKDLPKSLPEKLLAHKPS